jgi:hypothetical protein
MVMPQNLVVGTFETGMKFGARVVLHILQCFAGERQAPKISAKDGPQKVPRQSVGVR